MTKKHSGRYPWNEAETDRLSKTAAKETSIYIIDIFEEFLNKRGIVIENSEKEEYGDKETCANIFGADYFELEEEIKSALEKHDIRFLFSLIPMLVLAKDKK